MSQDERQQVSRSAIFEHWQEWLLERGCDVKIPQCFGCGISAHAFRNPPKSRDHSSVVKRWEKAKHLERAHIVPFALGGACSPDNMVLLCKRCHSENPNTKDRNYYMRWLWGREWFVSEMLKEGFKALELSGVTEEEAEHLNRHVTPSSYLDIRKFYDEYSVTVPGHKLFSMFTAVPAIVAYAREQQEVATGEPSREPLPFVMPHSECEDNPIFIHVDTRCSRSCNMTFVA